MRQNNNVDQIGISNKISFTKEFIGCVYNIVSVPYSLKKCTIIKKNNQTIVQLSNVIFFSNNFLFNVYKVNTIFHLNMYFVIDHSLFGSNKLLKNSFFLQYGSFSQKEWRYLRHFLSIIWFTATVVHSGFYNISIRDSFFYSEINSFKHGHLLLLNSYYSNISIHALFINIYFLSIFFSRSRLDENFYSDDFFNDSVSSFETEQFLGHDFSDDVIDQETHFSVEEQITLSGVFLNDQLCSYNILSDIFCFSFISYYEMLCSIFIFLRNISTFLFYISFFYLSLFFFSFFYLHNKQIIMLLPYQY